MAKNRKTTNLVHQIGDVLHKVSLEKKTGFLFIINTNIRVPFDEVSKTHKDGSRIITKRAKPLYDFSKPSSAQNLGDEWSDYAWSGDDY